MKKIALVLLCLLMATSLFANGANEKDELKIGFIKLTDMAPLAVAYENGYFEDEGLYVTLEAQANWKVLLDRVISGDLDGADVVQVYADLPDSDAPKRLVGFARVEVAAGSAAQCAIAVPLDRTPIPGGDHIRYVLEINGGLASTLGIEEGAELRHPSIDQDLAAWPCAPE